MLIYTEAMAEPILRPGYSYPEESNTRRLRNCLIEFKKMLKNSKDFEGLSEQMEHFINISRKVIWPHHTSSTFCKDAAEKAVEQVIAKFQRYTQDPSAQQDLLDAISEVETFIDRLKDKR